ncbi:MAG TPA: HIT family protein [Methylomirabilota bacterium]|nr:HIT family protein [Methylomirabilota bacterium]
MAFKLDPRLAQDTVPVGDLALCRVLLMNDATYPWLILVPRRDGLADIVDLDADGRALLMEEIALASEALKTLAQPLKLNVAALGNMVRQLHVHVIARTDVDPAWPAPVWGKAPAVAYHPVAAAAFRDRVAAAIGPALKPVTQS